MSKVFLCTVCKVSVQSHMFRRGHVCSFKCVGVCFCNCGRIWKCVCVREMLCMCDVVYPFGQALGMFAPSCVCVWVRCCVCVMLCTHLARRWACLLLHVCVCERDVVYVGCCVPVWPGVGHVCSFMCVCVREMLCMCDVVYPFGQALGMFAPSCLCVWVRCCVCGMLCTRLARRWACLLLHVCVCERDVVYVGCCVPVWPGVGHVCSFMCVCVSEMLCMWDVVYPFGQALGMFAPSCVCVWARCCVCGMLCTRLARRWACLLLHVCVCERDVVYVGCCVPVWPGVGHVCSFMCVCVSEMLCMWDVVYPFGQALGMFNTVWKLLRQSVAVAVTQETVISALLTCLHQQHLPAVNHWLMAGLLPEGHRNRELS